MDKSVRKMVLRFTVGEQPPVELDLFDLDLDETIALQAITGRTFKEMTEAVDNGDAVALKVFYWMARVHAGEQIAYTDPSLSPKWRDFTCEINPKS